MLSMFIYKRRKSNFKLCVGKVAQDVGEENIYTLRFSIIPVNDNPPNLAIGLQVFKCPEGDGVTLTEHNIMVTDVDTQSEDLGM